MKNLLLGIVSFFLIAIALNSCELEEYECTTSDWVGTYLRQSVDCSNPDLIFDSIVIISLGVNEGEIILQANNTSAPLPIDGCEITDSTVVLEIDDNELYLNIQGCEAYYEK